MADSRLNAAIIPLLLIVIALLGWMVFKQQTRPVPAAPVAPPAQVAPEPQADKAAQPGPDATASASQRHADVLKRLGVEADPAKAKAQREQELAALEAQHNAEARDPAWAAKTEQALADIAGSEVMLSTQIKPQNYQADCRATTCRITADFDNAANASDWGTFFLTGSGSVVRQARVIVVPNPDGSAQVRVYTVRR